MPKRGLGKLPTLGCRFFFDEEVQRVLSKYCLNFDWPEISSITEIVEVFVDYGWHDVFDDLKNESEFAEGWDAKFIRFYVKHPLLVAELLLAMTIARRREPQSRKDQIALVFDTDNAWVNRFLCQLTTPKQAFLRDVNHFCQKLTQPKTAIQALYILVV